MVGNDIVDIQEAKKNSNWQRTRFLEKLFTTRERHLISNSKDSFLMVWRLWSMKEAAYKLYTQLHPSRFYNPKAFECVIENTSRSVIYKDFECCVETKVTSNYIISEARINPSRMTSQTILFSGDNSENKSAVLKARLLEMISTANDISITCLNFSKSEFGIPTVNYKSKSINVSLTHHGNYGAIAI